MTQRPNNGTFVAPHRFEPIGLLDRFRIAGRCKRCLAMRCCHDGGVWLSARPMGDYSKPDIHHGYLFGTREKLDADD